MAAMHYTVMVERSSVKVFFTILVLHIFYFLQSEYIKILQNRKAKIILTYLYMQQYSEKNYDNTTPPNTRQNYVKVHAKNKSFSCGFAINCRQVLSPRNINKYKILQAFNDLFSSENMQYLIQLFTLIVIIPAIVSV